MEQRISAVVFGEFVARVIWIKRSGPLVGYLIDVPIRATEEKAAVWMIGTAEELDSISTYGFTDAI